MKIVLLGRKPAAAAALRLLVERGHEVAAVVAPVLAKEIFWQPQLRATAEGLGIPVVTDYALYEDLEAMRVGRKPTLDLSGTDLVISFLFWKKIRQPLIELPRIGCFNFHPAPLPSFRGRRGYNFAILEGHTEYGATVHWIDSNIDTGDLVEVRTFPITSDETALSLEHKTMSCLLDMFGDFISRVEAGGPLPAIPQGEGKSATKQELLDAMRILPSDSAETVARKVRAFWYPPHTGATVEIGGIPYTLVDAQTLSTLGQFIHSSRRTPW